MFLNGKCRVCGGVVSVECRNDPWSRLPPAMVCKQELIKKCHPSCSLEPEPSESVIFDVISLSEKPLKRAADVYYLSKGG